MGHQGASLNQRNQYPYEKRDAVQHRGREGGLQPARERAQEELSLLAPDPGP